MHTLRDLLLFAKAQPSEVVEGFAKDVLADLLDDIGYPLSAQDVRAHDRVHLGEVYLWKMDDAFAGLSDYERTPSRWDKNYFDVLTTFRSHQYRFSVFLDTVREVDDAV